MKLKPIIHITGLFFLLIGLLMLVPAMMDYANHNRVSTDAYSSSSFMVTVTSLLMIFSCRPKDKMTHMSAKEMLLLTNIIWIGSGLVAAIPMMLAENVSYTDAVYEAVSGITTTGGTIFQHLAQVSKGTLLWRSLLQWVGGIGFIVVGIAVLPFLKIGGMRLFQTESSDTSEKILPRSGAIAKRILGVYIILSFICILLLKIEGMSWFDAVNYGMATISTGGFSTHDNSMAFYHSSIIYWTVILFMLVGSIPFLLIWRFSRGEYRALTKDSQVRTFIMMMIGIWMIVGVWLWLHSDDTFFNSITLAAFNTTSVVSTTGFVLTDYSSWGHFAICIFFFLAFIGGCSGSTSGGLKIFRLQISFRLLSIELKKQAHPRAVILHQYNGQKITDDILRSLIAFSFFYLLAFALLSLAISLTQVDFTTAISSVIGNLSNAGPGLGVITGPAGTYATLPSVAKWLLSLAMLIGRLEIITMLVLFSPNFWRR